MPGVGRLSPRALETIAVGSTPRHSAAMSKSSDTSFAGSAYDRLDYDSLDEDTIEIVLSPEEMQLLSRSADEALAEAKATRALAASVVASLTPTATPARARVPITAAPGVAKAPAATVAAAVAQAPAAPAAPPAIKLPTAAAVAPTVKPPAAATAAPTIKRAAAPVAPPPTETLTAPKAPPTVATLAATETPAPKANAASHRAAPRPSLRIVGILAAVAATAVALASITHHAQHATVRAAAPVPAAPATAASTQPTPTVSEPNTPEALAAPDQAAAQNPTEPEPVRVKNPFDHSEVFEFPAGTSLKEARQSIADILMQRAHERGIPPLRSTRADRHPVARSSTHS